MSVMDEITAMVVQGSTLADVIQAYPAYTYSTLKTYVARANAGLTDEQRRYRDRQRAKRPAKRVPYHRKYQEQQTLGPVHVRIGRKLLEARLLSNMKSGEFCETHNFSNQAQLSRMEQGYHDFTVTEVQLVADLLGTTVEELLSRPQEMDEAA